MTNGKAPNYNYSRILLGIISLTELIGWLIDFCGYVVVFCFVVVVDVLFYFVLSVMFSSVLGS